MVQGIIRRGSAQRHSFTLPFTTDITTRIWVTYRQGSVSVTKSEVDSGKDAFSFRVSLSQQDTLKFESGREVEVQVKVCTIPGEFLVSETIRLECMRGLCGEVMI